MIGDDWLKLDCNKLSQELDRWLRVASESGYWSEQNETGQIFCWKSFWDASKDKSKKPDFDSPGCYLLGVGSGHDSLKLRYVGQTKNTLKSRLGNRYISSKKPDNFTDARIEQFNLADWLIAHNNEWRKLPEDKLVRHFNHVRRQKDVEYIRKHEQPTARIKHAMDFAERAAKLGKYGSDKMWFALIPMTSSERTKTLECYLLSTLIRWNEKNSHPRLLNDVY
jgi:hypothetical protein